MRPTAEVKTDIGGSSSRKCGKRAYSNPRRAVWRIPTYTPLQFWPGSVRVLCPEPCLIRLLVTLSRMSRVFDNGGDVSIRRMRVGSINVHCSSPQHSHAREYYDSDEEPGGSHLPTPERGRSRSGSRSRSLSRERAGYRERGEHAFLVSM